MELLSALEHNTPANLGLLAFSVFLLWKGSDWLIDGSTAIGRALGMSDLTIGLTIVAFGTSAPEFAVTISAALTEHSDISVGNIVGSNIFNIGFILGGCAAVRTLQTTAGAIWRDGALLVLSSILLVVILCDQQLSRIEGGLLLFGLFCYVMLLWKTRFVREAPMGPVEYFRSWRGSRERAQSEEQNEPIRGKDVLWVALGLVGVILGGHLLVESASSIARQYGISEWTIAVTIVAAGTSAPELATSLVAATKGRMGISLGNLIGSDLFNLLGVLGVAGLIRPLGITEESLSSLYMLVGMCLLAVVLLRTGWRLSRWEGIMLISVGVARWTWDFLG